jgi:hypothetical protein
VSRFGRIEVEEQGYQAKQNGKQVRPFKLVAKVGSRGISLGLQRVLVDFGADQSYARAVLKVREHYGVEVSESAIRTQSMRHGEQMQMAIEVEVRLPNRGVKTLVSEMDGMFIPIVTSEGAGDRRKHRRYEYQEAKMCLAGQLGVVQRRYRATLAEAEAAGKMWKVCVAEAGGGQETELHCLGDGAKWIEKQMQKQFPDQATYLVDYYHVSEYLAKAGEALKGKQGRKWLKEQQERMKRNEVEKVLEEIRDQQEGSEVEALNAPIRRCYRYIEGKKGSLDYQGAIEKGLPIGSGEIESGNKSVLQARLKITGAWWKKENAEKMIGVRTTRANGEWDSYWKQQRSANA